MEDGTLAQMLETHDEASAAEPAPRAYLEIENLSVHYGEFQALRDVTLSVERNSVLAIIGPSGCGKSTLLRAINRMNEEIPGTVTTGSIRIGERSIYESGVDPANVRRKVGIVFQRPNPFPTSIYDNIVWGVKINRRDAEFDAMVERTLRQVGLWSDLKDRLKENAWRLSGGQQQRLCLARALALEPDILLMDEPTSSLDPVTSAQIEDLIGELRQQYTLLVASHNLNQAARISDRTAFMLMDDDRSGRLELVDDTKGVFLGATNERLREYILGRHDHWTA